jgi:alpha/beta superfamily hydrolase
VSDPDRRRRAPRPRSEPFSIPGPAGPIEALVEDPGGAPSAVGVVCHPHPLYHGTMNNKVVHTVARAMNRLGSPAVRFNFRGVGESAGAWDEGRGETDDLLAVAAWARGRWQGALLWLAGFSFGAFVVLRAAGSLAPAALVTVAPPVRRFPIAELPVPAVRWLVVQGEADELTDFREVRDWARSASPQPELALLPDTSHFFHGKLGELQAVVTRFLEQE